jgi:hypothetical protein
MVADPLPSANPVMMPAAGSCHTRRDPGYRALRAVSFNSSLQRPGCARR